MSLVCFGATTSLATCGRKGEMNYNYSAYPKVCFLSVYSNKGGCLRLCTVWTIYHAGYKFPAIFCVNPVISKLKI